MKLNSTREVWIARLIAWVVLGLLSCGIIFGSTFMIGPMLFAVPNLGEKIATALYCPGAKDASTAEGASTPTTTSPSGTYGHTVEIACTFADGSTKVIRNEEFALSSIGGMFGLGGLCGVGISIPLMLAPFFLIRGKKVN
jgi:hypothetical protein